MNKMRSVIVIVIVYAMFGLGVCDVCAGRTITVDAGGGGDFTSIQEAIADEATVDGDEIEVAPGTYYEAIDFLGKAVRLYSSGGPEVTIIDANDQHYHVVQCVSGEGPNTILEGFTITGGNAYQTYWPANCGGGMYNSGSSPTVTNCTFNANSVSGHGAGMLNYQSSPTVTNCNFSGNVAAGDGGGMHNSRSSQVVTDCTFIGNEGNNGGGLYNFQSSPSVTDCVFIGNSVALFGGGMSNWDSSSPTVTNCSFAANTAEYGGGMFNHSSSPAVCNCTFSRNSAEDEGGGMHNYSSSPAVTSCILWNDTPEEIFSIYSSSPTVTYSSIQGNYIGTGNIDADPLFVDPNGTDGSPGTVDDNLRLSRGSPCIDAGNSSAVPAGVMTDLNAWSRFIDDECTEDTGTGTPPIVDMGAYEFQPADIDGSGSITFQEYGILAVHWQQFGGDCQGADVNCDGLVDWLDMAILVTHWLEGS